ncbi:MAG: BsaA family SipW-dependent biofilm matrix protein [Thomasclavelia ramosa]
MIHYGDYYYYLGVIGEDEASNGLLNSVKMNSLLDATVSAVTVVEADEQGTTTVTKKYQYGKYGYDSADYTLTVEARTVQASKAAIRDAFGDNVMAVYLAISFATIAEQQ